VSEFVHRTNTQYTRSTFTSPNPGMPQSARQQDQNGYLLIRGCPISTFGIFQYSAAQVGLPGDPNRIVNVYRPEAAVSDPEYVNSFQVVPLINDHEMLSGFQGDESATAPEEYGIDGVLYDVGYKQPWTRGDLKIFSRSMQADLNAGKKDLSLGYTCDFVLESGTFDGQDYEVIQTNMRGNHIALVDIGRVPGAKVLDGKRLCFDSLSFSTFSTNGGAIMPKPRRALDSTVVQQLQAQLKALLPTFEQFLSEEASEPAHQGGEGGAGAEAGAANAAASGEEQSAVNAGGEEGSNETGIAADPNAAEAGGEMNEGEEDGENEAALMDALKQVQDICAKLMSQMGGAQAGAGGDEGGEGGEGGAEGGESNGAEGTTEDTVEGLAGTAREGEDGEEGAALGEGGQGSASEGPAAGKHKGADAALRSFYADAARKNRLYDRLSRVVGAFDGAVDVAAATHADIASYGVKKLGIKCAKGTEAIALDAYLTGVEKACKSNAVTTTKQRAQDAAAAAVPVIEAYFKE